MDLEQKIREDSQENLAQIIKTADVDDGKTESKHRTGRQQEDKSNEQIESSKETTEKSQTIINNSNDNGSTKNNDVQMEKIESSKETTEKSQTIINNSNDNGSTKNNYVQMEQIESSKETTEKPQNIINSSNDDGSTKNNDVQMELEADKSLPPTATIIEEQTNFLITNSAVKDNFQYNNDTGASNFFISITPAAEVNKNIEDDSDSDTDSNNSVVSFPVELNSSKQSQITCNKSLENTGLGAIASQYNSTSESEYNTASSADEDNSSSDSVQIVDEVPISIHNHRPPINVISSDSDSDVEVISNIIEEPKLHIDDDDETNNGRPKGPVRAKGEMLLEDLPPIEDLHITVPEEECVELGKVHSIVEQLVLVDCIPGTAALNLDTVLFLEKGHKVLGEVFDVIGQVCSPLYCVRFNSNKQIHEKDIKVGQTVYVAPRTEHTHFLILSNIISIRGSDASWEDDIEPPEKHLEYSDDEEERNAKRTAIRIRKQHAEETDPAKKQKALQSSPSQPQDQQHSSPQSQNARSRRGQQYRGPSRQYDGVNQGSQMPPPFQYNKSNTTWHANFSGPISSSRFPNPYSQQFNYSGNNGQQQYNSPPPSEYSQYAAPNNNNSQFIPPNQRFAYGSSRQQSTPPNPHYNTSFTPPQFMSPNQSNSHFVPPNQYNNSPFMPSSNQNNARFRSPNSSNNPQFFNPPPPPPPRQ